MYEPTRTSMALKKLLDEKGVSQRQLSILSKVKQPTISRIISGESREPRRSNLESIAAALDVPLSALHGESKPDDRSKAAALNRVVPMIGDTLTGPNDDGLINPGALKRQSGDHVAIPSNDPGAYALLVATGDYGARARAGEAFIISPSAKVEAGDEVAVRFTSGDFGVFSLVSLTKDRLVLSPVTSSDPQQVVNCDDIDYVHYVESVARRKMVVIAN